MFTYGNRKAQKGREECFDKSVFKKLKLKKKKLMRKEKEGSQWEGCHRGLENLPLSAVIPLSQLKKFLLLLLLLSSAAPPSAFRCEGPEPPPVPEAAAVL